MLSVKLIGRLLRVLSLSSSLDSPFLNLSPNGIVASSAISTSTNRSLSLIRYIGTRLILEFVSL